MYFNFKFEIKKKGNESCGNFNPEKAGIFVAPAKNHIKSGIALIVT